MTRPAFLPVAVVWLLAGCGGGGGGSGSTTLPANTCATPGATYTITLSEEAGGTCGAVSPVTVTIGSDGTITEPTSASCIDSMMSGCQHTGTCAIDVGEGVTCDITTDVTFRSDGGGATGTETWTCAGPQSCHSTYSVIATRQ